MVTAVDKIRLAKAAANSLAQSNTLVKNQVLRNIATLLPARAEQIIAANAIDLANGVASGLSTGLQDRLKLDDKRIQALADAVSLVIDLPDPVGDVVRGRTLPNGLQINQVRVPFGVIGAIYEARPNVTIDIAALAIKSGNATVLRGGTAAENTNAVLVTLLQDALEQAGVDRDAVQTVDEFGRQGANDMMQAVGLIDVLVPRGGAGLIKSVVNESKVPVIQTGDGVVHIFIDESARVDWAVEIVLNSKTQRPSVCNALETLLVHQNAVDTVLPAVVAALKAKNVVLHGDQTMVNQFGAVPATEDDWNAEYYTLDLAVKVVADIDEALQHIAKYSTHHTESILTENVANAEKFLAQVDSAVVMVNASTRFTDGEQMGFGAEIGISNQKLHARGPMGLEQMTTTTWIVWGTGQIR